MGTSAATQVVEGTRRPAARTRTIGLRVTEPEYVSLEREAWNTGKTVADWARECLLRELQAEPQGRLEQHVFTELVGIQLLLMNTLGPLLRGERVTAEQLDSLLRQVQSTKAKKAQELLNKRMDFKERGV